MTIFVFKIPLDMCVELTLKCVDNLGYTLCKQISQTLYFIMLTNLNEIAQAKHAKTNKKTFKWRVLL